MFFPINVYEIKGYNGIVYRSPKYLCTFKETVREGIITTKVIMVRNKVTRCPCSCWQYDLNINPILNLETDGGNINPGSQLEQF